MSKAPRLSRLALSTSLVLSGCSALGGRSGLTALPAATTSCTSAQADVFQAYLDAWNSDDAKVYEKLVKLTSPQFERTAAFVKPAGRPADAERWNQLTSWPWKQQFVDGSGVAQPEENQLSRYIRGIRHQWETFSVVADAPNCSNATEMTIAFRFTGTINYSGHACTVSHQPGTSSLGLDSTGKLLHETMHLDQINVDICEAYTGPEKQPNFFP